MMQGSAIDLNALRMGKEEPGQRAIHGIEVY